MDLRPHFVGKKLCQSLHAPTACIAERGHLKMGPTTQTRRGMQVELNYAIKGIFGMLNKIQILVPV